MELRPSGGEQGWLVVQGPLPLCTRWHGHVAPLDHQALAVHAC